MTQDIAERIDTEGAKAQQEASRVRDRLRRTKPRIGQANSERMDGTLPGIYWRKSDGWITHSFHPESTQGKRHISVKHWEPLKRYPRVLHEVEYAQPFVALFRAGGEVEFPPEQIIAYGWDLTPPIVLDCKGLDEFEHPEHDESCMKIVRFPQLAGVEVKRFKCELCPPGRAGFLTEGHLKAHTEVMHNEHLVNKELVTGLRDALAPLVTQPSAGLEPQTLVELVTSTVITVMEQMKAPKGEEEEATVAASEPPEEEAAEEAE